MSKRKILFAYYSLSGNMEEIFKIFNKNVEMDGFVIETVEEYILDEYFMDNARKEIKNNRMPPLKRKISLEPYDCIILGTPNWWGNIPPAVNTFIQENSFKDKKLGIVVVHDGGGINDILRIVKEKTKVKKRISVLELYKYDWPQYGEKIRQWIHLNFKDSI